jgi:predicted TIM-barrel fold metal-dependent hydrolase
MSSAQELVDWDCHAHIGIPPADPTAGGMGLGDYIDAVAKPLNIKRTVLVQPSGLRGDHTALFAALRELGDAARGVAELTGDREQLVAYCMAGVRGIRFAPRLRQGGSLECILEKASVLRDLNLHVQVYADLEELPTIVYALHRAGLSIVLDHFARLPLWPMIGSEAVSVVQRLLDQGACWIKFSGAYHLSGQAPPFEDLADLATTLFRINPDRIVWGSDWPHPNSPTVDEHVLFRTLESWGFGATAIHKIRRENPGRLYD